MKRLVMFTVVVLTMFLCISGTDVVRAEQPDATLKMTQGQFAIGIGWSWGEGVLTYQGKEYPFKVKGLTVVDIGITKATSTGKVYNLKKLEDFNGNYMSGSAEGTLGGGAGALSMKNQNGVVIDLVSTTQGVNLKLAVGGVDIELKK